VLLRIATEQAGGRFAAVLEGSYDLDALRGSVARVLDEMEGERFSNNKANVEKYGFNYASTEQIGEMLRAADLVIPF